MKRSTLLVAKQSKDKKPASKSAQAKSLVKKEVKTSSKKVVIEKKDEFRTNKNSGHHAYIYAKVGNKFKYLGLTTAPITSGVINIKLEKNPEPNNDKDSYVRPMSRKAKVKKFKNKTLKGWKMSDKDKKKLKPLMK